METQLFFFYIQDVLAWKASQQGQRRSKKITSSPLAPNFWVNISKVNNKD